MRSSARTCATTSRPAACWWMGSTSGRPTTARRFAASPCSWRRRGAPAKRRARFSDRCPRPPASRCAAPPVRPPPGYLDSAALELVEEFVVVGVSGKPLHQGFHRFHRLYREQHLPQLSDLLVFLGREELFLFA